MSGSFWGGAALGLMGAVKMAQDQQRIDMEQRKADREEQAWQEQQDMKKQLKDIGSQEQSDRAGAANAGAVQNSANSYAVDDYLAKIPDASDEEKDAVRKAFTGDTGAQYMANSAVSEAMNNTGAPVSVEQEKGIQRAWGLGYKSDPRTAYDFSLRRARVFEDAGDFKSAQAIKDQANSEAIGHFTSAILNKDATTAADLYNLFPNGHQLKNLTFDAKGNINTIDSTGHRVVVTPYDAIAAGMAHMKPEAAATMIMTKFKTEEQMERLIRTLKERGDEQSARILSAIGSARGAGGGSGGAVGAGTARGSAGAEGLYGIPGIKTQDDMGKFIERWTGKDSVPPIIGADGKVVDAKNINPIDYRNSFESVVTDLAEAAGGQINSGQLGAVATKIVQSRYAPNESVSIRPVLGQDGSVSMIATVDGRPYKLGKRDMNDAEIGKYFDLKSEAGKAGYASTLAERDAIKAEDARVKAEAAFQDPTLHRNAIQALMRSQGITAEEAEDQFATSLTVAKNRADDARKRFQQIGGYGKSEGAGAPKKPGLPGVQSNGDGMPNYGVFQMGQMARLERAEKNGTLSPSEKKLLEKFRSQKQGYSLIPEWMKGRAGESNPGGDYTSDTEIEDQRRVAAVNQRSASGQLQLQ